MPANIPLAELTDDPAAKATDLVQKGDKLELIVLRVNDVEGTVMLSKKRLDAIAGFEKIAEACESGEILEGVVTEVVRGGVLVLTNGVKVFIPASQLPFQKRQPRGSAQAARSFQDPGIQPPEKKSCWLHPCCSQG